MTELLKFCPEDRYLVHGDYGFGNILSDGTRITAVIDWEASMYGDFLFDVAWLSFWSRKPDLESLYAEHLKSQNREVPHFAERILCYKLYIGLRTLSFFAYSNQKEKYDGLKEHVGRLVTPRPAP